MRTSFIETLFGLAKNDRRIMLVVGDLGFGVVTRFKEELSSQFVNAGVAEQNMTGLAAGLALSGKIVFTYSIANFPVIRCLEQIRNDVCYHSLNVRIVSVGGGMAYGSLGPSHHATEDLALMRALPNMTVLAPGDPIEVAAAVRQLIQLDGPAYLRLGRDGEATVHSEKPNGGIQIGKAVELRNGSDLTLISTGGMLSHALSAAETLSAVGLSAKVLSMHTLKPLDVDAILRACAETRAIFTVEEHSIIGGLGSAVAEALAESDFKPAVFKRIGLNGEFSSIVGEQEYLLEQFGLHPDGIVETVTSCMQSGRLSRT